MNSTSNHGRRMIVAFLAGLACALSASVFAADAPRTAVVLPLQDQYSSAKGATAGIRIVSMALSANDHLVDMRYAVADLEKARTTLKRKSRIYLQDEANGRILAIANFGVGMLRDLPSTDAKRGYVMMFNNANRSVKRGDKVTLIIDDIRIEGIVVR